jgi:hypothetical protein
MDHNFQTPTLGPLESQELGLEAIFSSYFVNSNLLCFFYNSLPVQQNYKNKKESSKAILKEDITNKVLSVVRDYSHSLAVTAQSTLNTSVPSILWGLSNIPQ